MNEMQFFELGLGLGFVLGLLGFLLLMLGKPAKVKRPRFRIVYGYSDECGESVWRVYRRKGLRWVKTDETPSAVELCKLFTAIQLQYDLDTMPSKN